MISQETIDRVRASSDVVDIISEYVKLKRRGRNFIGRCPFHTEKTPSFTVSPDKQIYHCFGCSTGGNVFTFLMEHEKMSFVEAVQFLAAKAGVVIKETQSDYQRDEFARLNYANQVALEYFQKTLRAPKYKAALQSYLGDKRGLTDETIEHFHLGLASEEWDGLLKYARKKDLHPETLEKAGLVIKSEKQQSYFDRFRQRLMIPIFNLSKKPIAFGGRTLKKGEPAKYVNSPETPLYSKSNVLYGLNFSRDALRAMNFVYVVEGYFDVISLHQIGIKNVVASSGTAFTQQQARLLARFVDEAYLFFDSDSAGHNAAIRSVDLLYDAGLDVKIIEANEGEDPDSIARIDGRNRIEELKDHAVDFISFRTSHVDFSSSGVVAREKLTKEIKDIGHKISDRTRRSIFFDDAAKTLKVNRQLFDLDGPAKLSPPSDSLPRKRQHDKAEREFISLMFSNPSMASHAFETVGPDDFDSRLLAHLFTEIARQHHDAGEVDINILVDSLDDPATKSLATELAAKEWDPDQVDSETDARLRVIANAGKKRVRDRLKTELADAEAAGDQARAKQLVDELKLHGLGD